MKYVFLVAAILSLAVGRWARCAEPPTTIASPADVWQGYDPTALPLEVESIKQWEESGCRFEKIWFTSETFAGGRARVFAIQGAPLEGNGRAGVLHIHGGGQTASLDWVKFWAKRGYVAATFDYCGPWADRTEVTDWGAIKHANMAQAAGGFQVEPTVRESSWFHWSVASRRALSLLAEHPQVDRERLGIFGISMGGTLCWMVAGSDPRVKTAVPIYGCGYNHDRRKVRWGFPELSPELALFQRTMSSEAHVPYISCPLLFLNATNDFHGWLDNAYDVLSAGTGPRWQAFTPRHNHHIAAAQGADLPAWMDFQLRSGPAFPASPTVEVVLDEEGRPVARVATGTDRAERVDVFYSLGDKPPPNRFWRRAEGQRAETKWTSALGVLDTWQPVFAFANVTYPSGVCLSTNLANVVPAQLGKARATVAAGDSLEPRQIAESWFYATAYTDPTIDKPLLQIDDGADGKPVVTLPIASFGDPIHFNLASHLIGDPQFTGMPGQALAFDCAGGFDGDGLSVTLFEKDSTPLAKKYATTVGTAELTPGWKTVVLPLGRLQTAEGKSPEAWGVLDKIQLQGKTSRKDPLRIANLRWVEVDEKE